MDLNQLPPDKPLSHYSVMGSAHPMDSNEGSETQVGGSRGSPGAMPEWLTQLMTRANDNNSHQSIEQFQKMKPPVFIGEWIPYKLKDGSSR